VTLDEALSEMADVLFDENLLRVALCHICGSIFFTADGSDRRCAQCRYELAPDEEALTLEATQTMTKETQVLICDKCGAENWNLASEGKSHNQPASEVKGYDACDGIWRSPSDLAADPRPGKLIFFPVRKGGVYCGSDNISTIVDAVDD